MARFPEVTMQAARTRVAAATEENERLMAVADLVDAVLGDSVDDVTFADLVGAVADGCCEEDVEALDESTLDGVEVEAVELYQAAHREVRPMIPVILALIA